MTAGKLRLLLISLPAVALGGCLNPSGDHDAVADQVSKEAAGIVAAYNAQNAKATAAFDAPDYVGIFHGQPNTVGPAADEASMKAQMASARVEWSLGPHKITVSKSGDMAVFEAPYTFTVTEPTGEATRETGTWIAIFKRPSSGELQLWRSIGVDDPPKSPGA